MKTKIKTECKVCYGYDLIPMGRMDSEEWGELVIKCPWCGAGTVMDNDRYALLEGEKLRLDKMKGGLNKN